MTSVVVSGGEVQALKTMRSLGRQAFVPGAILPFKIPQDIVVKEFIIVVNGYMSCTFSGSKPAVNPIGILHGLLAQVKVSRRGTDTVKAFKGTRHLRATLERKFGQADTDLYSVNATDLSGTVVQGLPVWGTTGQNVAIRSSIPVQMENKISNAHFPSLLNTKGLQTGVFSIECGQWGDVQDPENTDSNTYAGALTIEVFASCSDFLANSPDGNMGIDYLQEPEELEFSGAQSSARHWINPKGRLQGILISGTHTGNKPFSFKNMHSTRLEVKYKGVLIAEGTMADFLEIDMHKTHLSSRLKGSCYLSLLNNSDVNSGLNIEDGKQLELIVTTDSTLSYSSPVKLIFEYDQLAAKPAA